MEFGEVGSAKADVPLDEPRALESRRPFPCAEFEAAFREAQKDSPGSHEFVELVLVQLVHFDGHFLSDQFIDGAVSAARHLLVDLAYIEQNDRWCVAGISSFSIGPPRTYGSRDHYTRVSTLADWILATMQDTTATAPMQVFDLTQDPFPDWPFARVAREFVDAFNAGDETFLAFVERHRGGYGHFVERREIYGQLTPLRFARVDARRVAVLVSLSSRPGFRVINFWFDGEGTLDDVSLGMALDPSAP